MVILADSMCNSTALWRVQEKAPSEKGSNQCLGVGVATMEDEGTWPVEESFNSGKIRQLTLSWP